MHDVKVKRKREKKIQSRRVLGFEYLPHMHPTITEYLTNVYTRGKK